MPLHQPLGARLARLSAGALVLLLAACGSGPQAASPSGSAATAPRGEVTFVAPDFGPTGEGFDPSRSAAIIQSAGFGIGGPIYEPMYIHMPPNAEVKPFLVESGQPAADGLSWTFKLKNGIKWSTGDPMTADDVQFSLTRYRSPESTSASAATFRSKIKDIAVVDPLTVRVNLNELWVDFPIYLAGRLGNEGVVLPKKYIEQVGWDAFDKNPIGSGPYKMTDHKIKQSITYEANDAHWRTKPSFTKINHVLVAEERTRIAMLQSGKADMTIISPEAKAEVERGGFTSKVIPYAQTFRVVFYGTSSDYPDSPLKKPEVRKALTLGIDKPAVLQGLFAGAGEVANYAVSAPGFTLGAPKLPPTPYDATQARNLLAQAGYPNGLQFTFWAAGGAGCSAEVTKNFAETIASYWSRIGATAKIQPVEFTLLRPKLTGARVTEDLVGTASTFCTGPSPSAARDLGVFYYGKGTYKFTNVADADIARALAAPSLDEQVKATEAAYQKIYDDYTSIGVFHGGSVYATSKLMADYPITPGFENVMGWLTNDRPKG